MSRVLDGEESISVCHGEGRLQTRRTVLPKTIIVSNCPVSLKSHNSISMYAYEGRIGNNPVSDDRNNILAAPSSEFGNCADLTLEVESSN